MFWFQNVFDSSSAIKLLLQASIVVYGYGFTLTESVDAFLSFYSVRMNFTTTVT